MKNVNKLCIKKPLFINPFLAYSIFWVATLILYCISPSKANQVLNVHLVFFLIFSIFITFLLGIYFNWKFKNKVLYLKYKKRHKKLILCLILLSILLEIIYSRNIPVLSYLKGSEGGYKDFGIPTFHVIISTFLTFYSIYSLLIYRKFKRKIDFVLFLTSFSYFLLIFSRGILLFIIIASICLILCERRIRFKTVLWILVAGMLLTIAFGALGNIRSGYKWNDSWTIIYFGKIDADRHSIFSTVYWVEEYVICSLRNLNYNIVMNHQSISFTGYIASIIPDFISKRFYSFNFESMLIIPAFTTGTAYTNDFMYGGFIGMYFSFFLYVIIGIIFMKLKFKNETCQLVCLSMLFFIFGLSIFDDMLVYSGYSFALVYPVLYSFFTKRQVKRMVILDESKLINERKILN